MNYVIALRPGLRLVLLFVVALSLSACTLRSRSKGTSTIKEEKGRTTVVITEDMTADELADAGEQLVTPYTFMLADKTFALALKKDPAHGKAQFYRAFLKRFMAFKGILARVRPLVEKQGRSKEYLKQLRSFPESPLKSFLMDGPPDIRDASSAQTFLNQYVRSVNYLREFLVINQELVFSLQLNPYLHQEAIEKSWGKSCRMIPSKSAIMEVECQSKDIALRRVSPADLMILRQVAAGEVLALSIYASYSLKGLESLAKVENFYELPYETQLQILKGQPQFATLRSDHVMGLIHPIAQDFVSAVRWAERFQRELCPKGSAAVSEEEDQREGHLFSEGLCLADDGESVDAREIILTQIEAALRGAIPLQLNSHRGEPPFETIANPLIISQRPIIDLKTLFPDSLPSCQKKAELSDPTLGGIFPRADAPEYIRLQNCL